MVVTIILTMILMEFMIQNSYLKRIVFLTVVASLHEGPQQALPPTVHTPVQSPTLRTTDFCNQSDVAEVREWGF